MAQAQKIIIGSRDSKLALIQSNWVKAQLENKHPGLEIEIKKIKTMGDKILDVSLSKIGDKGLFIKELEKELLTGTVDLAVHSMKDLPTSLEDGLEIASTSEREDPRDVLCLSKKLMKELPNDLDQIMKKIQVIGTSSLRRVAQIKKHYPNIKIIDIRGNLNTRFKKLDGEHENSEPMDAIVLAAAGVKRLAQEDSNFEGRISAYFDPREILPAVGQGALAVEIASKRADIKELLESINSPNDEFIVKGERTFLRNLEGGCQVPIGVYSEYQGQDQSQIKYTGMVSSLDASNYLREEVSGNLEDAEDLGYELAQKLLKAGAKEILDNVRKASS